MNFQQVKKQLRHKRAQLNQVNAYRVMTSHCENWKKQRSAEIQNEINQLLELKATREGT